MKFIKDILRGIVIGVANIIPGVSGGTMAVSMGIYDQIIGSITNLFKQFKKSVKTLFPYAVGMILAIIGLSFVIETFLEKYPLPTASAFVGLILGGLPVILKKVRGSKGKSIQVDPISVVLFCVFFGLIIGLQLFGSGREGNVSLNLSVIEGIKLFFIGMIASATMVIPGVSGSMILLLLGYYNPIIETVNSTIRALSPFDVPVLLQNAGILVPFVLGIVIGMFAIAKMIEYLLRRFERRTYSAILGLVLASPFAIYLGLGVGVLSTVSILVSVLTLSVGFAVAYLLGRE